jgi:hypothetical protein
MIFLPLVTRLIKQQKTEKKKNKIKNYSLRKKVPTASLWRISNKLSGRDA